MLWRNDSTDATDGRRPWSADDTPARARSNPRAFYSITTIRRSIALSAICRRMGARLDVASALGIPDEFDVIFDADNSIRPCRLVWHKEKQLGVEFR